MVVSPLINQAETVLGLLVTIKIEYIYPPFHLSPHQQQVDLPSILRIHLPVGNSIASHEIFSLF